MTRQLLPLLLSTVTVTQMWHAGNLKAWAWTLGLANQGLWLAFIVVFQAWGLLPLCGALIVTYSRNLAKWRARERAERGTVRVPVRQKFGTVRITGMGDADV